MIKTFKPNLPDKRIDSAVVSCSISENIKYELQNRCIKITEVEGKMNCSDAIKHHADLYVIHCGSDKFFYAKNACSLSGELSRNFEGVDIAFKSQIIEYPRDVFFNAVFIGGYLVCCEKFINDRVLSYAKKCNIDVINVKQGYTKCNICVVNEKSIITEDFGIYKKLAMYGFDVLLLEKKSVMLQGYGYGFIGGASGKISDDELAFYGDIEMHPEYNRIYEFLKKRDVKAVSLSKEPLYDYGSLIPVE